MECMLWKAGIDTTEFTNPTGNGRVHMYRGSGKATSSTGPGTKIDNNTPSETALYVKDGSGKMPLTNYDMLVLACQGSDYSRSTTDQPALANWADLVGYANTGGRVFATHWSHSYMRVGTNNPLATTATWRTPDNNNDYPTSGTGTVVNDPTKNPRQADFKAWLQIVGALNTPITNPATFAMVDPRFDVSAVKSPAQTWVTSPRPNRTTHLPLHYTFNTPVSDGTGASCGRFVYSDFHVSKGDPTKNFPLNCGSWDNFTAQEKVLEFMLFDLSSCVTPYVPLCTPKTCSQLGVECGAAGDGCGNAIDCGTCSGSEVCGIVSPGKCDAFSCTPRTCASQGLECGAAGDGCGNALNCGTCPTGETCGASGPGQCGTGCSSRTCADQGLNCGPAGDGCGNALNCGTCAAGTTCGGGGVPGQCGTTCVKKTCSDLGYVCGAAGDGCGGALACGTCPSGQTCSAGKCVTGSCTPKTCAAQGFECGAAGDGCGAALDCGTCPSGKVCGIGGPGKCGASSCVPRTCSSLGYECGAAGDGCGASLDCGTCPVGETCGAEGPGKCGKASCLPQTCSQQGLECGLAGDGCGASIDCGTCPVGEVCGVGGPGKCGTPSCTPKTCAQQGIECGAAGDGCGASLNCGNCPVGMYCGLNAPGKCGAVLQ
jgi:hypothetical protein